MIGAKLAHYEITNHLGTGGMGEVYQATDMKLGRSVAIKLLPAAFASDPDRLSRFRREAQLLASLNHPNIAHIYGLEESGDTRCIVMELIEGETLQARIKKGPIPIDEALTIAKQIAEALEAAHEKGVIHRDLKPGNVMITGDGTVKVLDFGLAKTYDANPSNASLSNSPTMSSMAATNAGVILGTAAYMSPEQARGKAVDKRADIWAFGVVVYEMVTGRQLFQGEDQTVTLAAVVMKEPDFAAAPARLRRVLERCLQKDPKKRLRDISGVDLLLDEVSVPVAAASPDKTHRLPWAVATVAVVVLGISLWAWAPWRSGKPVDRPLVRLDVDLGADVALPRSDSSPGTVALSPDGTRLVYLSGNPAKLFIRRLDQPKAMELRGTEGALVPFFSPDSQWIGFVVSNKLSKISVDGGAVVPLFDVPNAAGHSWSEDDSILSGSQISGGIIRMPAGSGTPETLTELAKGERALAFPQLLPGGKAILFSSYHGTNADQVTIEVLTLADRKRKVLVRGGVNPRYLPSRPLPGGYLLYTNKSTLFAIPFDPDKLETHGTAAPVLDDVAYMAAPESGHFSPSPAGSLVYRKGSAGASAMTTVQWVSPSSGSTGKPADNNAEPLEAKPAGYREISISPDGKRLALTVADGSSFDIWVYDPKRDTMTRLTFGGGAYRYPTWSQDGQTVVFLYGGKGIYQVRADGASPPQALTQSNSTQIPWSFTPDGKRLAYFSNESGKEQIWTVPLEEQGGQLKAGKAEQFLKSGFRDFDPTFSPDGHWLAYQSNESGKNEVYVRAFPPPASGEGRKWQISNSGGGRAHWSRTSHELVYQSGDQIMTASYSVKGDAFVVEKPRVWIARTPNAFWDLAPDGRRVAMITPVDAVETPRQEHEVVLLLNFADELRRRVPLGK
jgi:serine/threonine protein kinase